MCPTLCVHLTGEKYKPYIQLIRTRRFGGVSPELMARVSRQLFPYKPFPPLKESDRKPAKVILNIRVPEKIPADGNSNINMSQWTSKECIEMERIMQIHSRWTVDYANDYVKSTSCEETTTNTDSICDECKSVAKDESFLRSIRRVRFKFSPSVSESLLTVCYTEKPRGGSSCGQEAGYTCSTPNVCCG